MAEGNALRQGIKDAEFLCYQNRGTPDAPGAYDCWNWEFDCAQLTYHQLQLFIINGTFLDKDTAETQSIDWCHFHASCAEAMSDKPKDWEGLIKVVQDNNADAIDKLTLAEIETMTHLRASATGSAFGNVTAFKNRFAAAVTAGNTSWVDIQRYIAGSGSVDTYWWYDGATANSAPNNLAALGAAAQPALNAVNYPDGVARITNAKLEAARAAFNANNTAGDNKTATAWVRMTKNLVKDHQETVVGTGDEAETIFTHTKFATFEEFRDVYLEALRKAKPEGYGYEDGDATPSWKGLQAIILELSKPSADPDTITYNDMPPEENYAEFWWEDGKTPLRVTSIGTLLKAAQYANSTDEDEKKLGEDALAKIKDVTTLVGDPYYLRSTIKGGALDDATTGYTDIAALIADVKAAQAAGAKDWNTLQYYLIHKTDLNGAPLPDETTVRKESGYYWWKGGGEGTAVDFSGVKDFNAAIKKLMEAAIRSDTFGDPKAEQSVTDQTDNGSFYKLTHLTPTNPATMPTPAENIDAMDWFTDTRQLLTKMNDLAAFMRNATGGDPNDIYTVPTVLWHQAQYWLLTGNYLSTSDSNYLTIMEEYWWYDKTEKPEPPPEGEPSQEMADALAAGYAGTADIFEWIDALTADDLSRMGFTYISADKTVTTADEFGFICQQMEYMMYDFGDNGYIGSEPLTWAQMQYYLTSAYEDMLAGNDGYGVFESHENAVAGLKGYGWTESDFPAGAKQ